jgi:hypothetical protein
LKTEMVSARFSTLSFTIQENTYFGAIQDTLSQDDKSDPRV